MPECPDGLKDETAAIRDLNDKLRQSFEGGQVLMTQGVNALAGNTLAQVLLAIRDFDDFTEDNDPTVSSFHEPHQPDIHGNLNRPTIINHHDPDFDALRPNFPDRHVCCSPSLEV